MIVELDRNTLAQVRNPALAAYAGQYLDIYDEFVAQISAQGIPLQPGVGEEARRERLAASRGRGAILRNDEKSVYANRISPACLACQTAQGCLTSFISLKCNRSCSYCFNPNQEDYERFTHEKRDLVAELEQLHSSRQKVKHLALTGGEPLLFTEDALAFFRAARSRFPKSYLRLYTCGDYVDTAILASLRDAGLDEIRFSIRMHDLEKGNRFVFEKIAQARDVIPSVMVEMPVLPGTREVMQGVLRDLDGLGVFGINLLEFCYPYTNLDAFVQRGYHIKERPFRVLYDYWYAGGLPVAGSEDVCLDLLDYALEQGLKLGVHYCSLENKHTGQVYQQNAGPDKPRTAYFSQRDFFLKTAKVFGADVPRVRRAFDRLNFTGYRLDPDHDCLEFPVNRIQALAKLEIEIGLSSGVIETRRGEKYLRELKVDLTTPQLFNLAQDV